MAGLSRLSSVCAVFIPRLGPCGPRRFVIGSGAPNRNPRSVSAGALFLAVFEAGTIQNTPFNVSTIENWRTRSAPTISSPPLTAITTCHGFQLFIDARPSVIFPYPHAAPFRLVVIEHKYCGVGTVQGTGNAHSGFSPSSFAASFRAARTSSHLILDGSVLPLVFSGHDTLPHVIQTPTRLCR
jgi:hypothetical protein